MRHNKKINHLSRKAAHRSALLSNMANSLIKHKRITTTVAKAKALRKFVEPLLTKAKTDTTESRRVVFRYLQDKYVVTELFQEIATKIADRPGGYTRIIKLGHRLGDNADMCFIELVDYNENMLKEKKEKKTRRGRGASSSAAKAAPAKAVAGEKEAEVVEVVEETPVVAEAPTAEAVVEEPVAETPVVEEAPAAEVVAEEPAAEEAPKAE